VVLDGRDVGETPLTLRNIAGCAHRSHCPRRVWLADGRRVVSAANPAPSLTVALARPAGPQGDVDPCRSAQSMAALSVSRGRLARACSWTES
jgi:hypothetical protein